MKLLEKQIQWHASDRASELFNSHRRSENLRETVEAIEDIAQTESEVFYQSGTILYKRTIPLLKASWLRRKDKFKEVYSQRFIQVYTKFKDHYKAHHPSEFSSS